MRAGFLPRFMVFAPPWAVRKEIETHVETADFTAIPGRGYLRPIIVDTTSRPHERVFEFYGISSANGTYVR
ncbi:MAG TPA: hypothetical protein VIS99_06635 [Terrimicrobiaceae bacterium]